MNKGKLFKALLLILSVVVFYSWTNLLAYGSNLTLLYPSEGQEFTPCSYLIDPHLNGMQRDI